MGNFYRDGGNIITNIKISVENKEKYEKYNDNKFVFHWIVDNIDSEAKIRKNSFEESMYSIDFEYEEIKLSVFVLVDDNGLKSTLMSPFDEIEDFYTFIRKNFDASTILTNEKRCE